MMIIALLLASAEPAGAVSLAEAARALASGRVEQARSMTSMAIEQGAQGDDLDLILGDLNYAMRRYASAFAHYDRLANKQSGCNLHEKAAAAGLLAGNVAASHRHIERALALCSTSAAAWNIRGVVADVERDWTTADLAYLKALSIAPGDPAIRNNRGWSLILQGRWNEALPLLESAAAEHPRSARIALNLDLARAVLDQSLPERRVGETEAELAARLNDAGFAALLRGDVERSRAALSQALEVRAEWFDRAANNLELTEVQQ